MGAKSQPTVAPPNSELLTDELDGASPRPTIPSPGRILVRPQLGAATFAPEAFTAHGTMHDVASLIGPEATPACDGVRSGAPSSGGQRWDCPRLRELDGVAWCERLGSDVRGLDAVEPVGAVLAASRSNCVKQDVPRLGSSQGVWFNQSSPAAGSRGQQVTD